MSDAANSLFSDDVPTPAPRQAPPKRAFKSRAASPTQTPPIPPENSSTAAVVAGDVRIQAGSVVQPSFKAREKPRDLSWEQAIRNLGDLLHPDEKTNYPEVFETKPEVRERMSNWRSRHGF